MTRSRTICLAWLGMAAVAMGAAWRMLSVPRLGDARMGGFASKDDVPYVVVGLHPPAGVHTALTAVIWMRLPRYNGSRMTTLTIWCPDPIQRSNPDLLAGAGGYDGAAIDLDALGGQLTVSGVALGAYGNAPEWVQEKWPRGVATVAGESSEPISVDVGGSEMTLGPGTFNKNMVAGPGDSVVVSGSGTCRVGVSQAPCARIFSELDGVMSKEQMGLLLPESLVTNEWAMAVVRLRCDEAGNQIYRADLGRPHAFDALTVARTNEQGLAYGYHSDGVYQLGLAGTLVPPFDVEIFDGRVYARWLSDEELERVHANGISEILRRGL